MSDLSDLELVAQAMAPIDSRQPAQAQPQSQSHSNPASSRDDRDPSLPSSAAGQDGTTPRSTSSSIRDSSTSANGANNAFNLPPDLADIDLSSLSPSDLAALQPLLAALSLGSTTNGRKGAPGGSVDGGELDLEDGDDENLLAILKQMDAAEGVADDLEGKLDKLLADLAGVEEGMKMEGLGEGGVLRTEKEGRSDGPEVGAGNDK